MTDISRRVFIWAACASVSQTLTFTIDPSGETPAYQWMRPGSELIAGMRYSETLVLTASTTVNWLGSKLPRETRTTAAGGNCSVMVKPPRG